MMITSNYAQYAYVCAYCAQQYYYQQQRAAYYDSYAHYAYMLSVIWGVVENPREMLENENHKEF